MPKPTQLEPKVVVLLIALLLVTVYVTLCGVPAALAVAAMVKPVSVAPSAVVTEVGV